MALPYFIWKGTDSRNMHLRCNRIPVVRPEERVSHITIPGRGGELTQTEGTGIYNSYIQTVSLTVESSAYVASVEKWLTGDGNVTFHAQPTLSQNARVINAVTFEKHSRNLDTWHAEVQFYCEPYKSLVDAADITVTESGTSIINDGDFTATPVLTITGSGASSISIGGNTLVLPALVSGWVVDCDLGWVTQNGVPQYNAWSGAFPVIPVGTSSVLFTGDITSIVITPRYKYL